MKRRKYTLKLPYEEFISWYLNKPNLRKSKIKSGELKVYGFENGKFFRIKPEEYFS